MPKKKTDCQSDHFELIKIDEVYRSKPNSKTSPTIYTIPNRGLLGILPLFGMMFSMTPTTMLHGMVHYWRRSPSIIRHGKTPLPSTMEKSTQNPINFQSSSPYPKEIPSPKLSPKNISDQW
jgi:hypothetical protein